MGGRATDIARFTLSRFHISVVIIDSLITALHCLKYKKGRFLWEVLTESRGAFLGLVWHHVTRPSNITFCSCVSYVVNDFSTNQLLLLQPILNQQRMFIQ